MKQGFDYHGALAPLEEVCRLADADILFVPDLMRTGTTRESLGRKVGIALRHLQFVGTIFLNRHRQLILVRDFSNIPLAVVFPLVRWIREKIVFVVNHNLQWTFGSRAERVAFRLLGCWGCRFAFLEEVPVGILENYGIDPARSLALPHPVPESGFKRHRTDGVKSIGIIGQFRPEKGIDELLDVLVSLAGKHRVIMGLPNPCDFRRLSSHSNADWIEILDTSAQENYMRVISECDVILLNHPSRGYEYRASGLIADAAAAHVPVVSRNLPALRHQLSFPVPIGECFDDLSGIPACVERISDRLVNGEYDFAAYNKARSAQALVQQLIQACNMTSEI